MTNINISIRLALAEKAIISVGRTDTNSTISAARVRVRLSV